MSFYEDEIPKDLEVGEEYTSRQIQIFLQVKRNIIVLEDSGFLPDSDEFKYKVTNKSSKYVHRNDNNSYIIPSIETVIYEVTRS
ncbi:hypothetical protein ACIQWI_21555 [Peribacillus frigoritolerans]